jgi:hypothetical protein
MTMIYDLGNGRIVDLHNVPIKRRAMLRAKIEQMIAEIEQMIAFEKSAKSFAAWKAREGIWVSSWLSWCKYE